jgi:hypothetical protein
MESGQGDSPGRTAANVHDGEEDAKAAGRMP